jgi:hypothetical protein
MRAGERQARAAADEAPSGGVTGAHATGYRGSPLMEPGAVWLGVLATIGVPVLLLFLSAVC